MSESQKAFASIGMIVSHYFQCMRRLVADAKNADEALQRENAALSIILAVSAIEAFLNIWFRTFSQEPQYAVHRARILSDLKRQRGVRDKLKEWPPLFFPQGYDFSCGAPQRMLALIDRRNKLLHFSTNEDSIELPDIVIEGLVDVSAYSSLTLEDASEALTVCEDIIRGFFELQQLPPEQVAAGIHLWTGVPPPFQKRG
jgi:hypothetical protein